MIRTNRKQKQLKFVFQFFGFRIDIYIFLVMFSQNSLAIPYFILTRDNNIQSIFTHCMVDNE